MSFKQPSKTRLGHLNFYSSIPFDTVLNNVLENSVRDSQSDLFTHSILPIKMEQAVRPRITIC